MNNSLTILLALIVFSYTTIVKSQIVTNELPPSFYLETSNYSILEEDTINQLIEVPTPDIKQLLHEDEKDIKFGKVWRFGKAIDLNFSLDNSGVWKHFNNGKSMWKLSIIADGAKSINLNFDTFNLSSSSKLFLYNKSHNDILGALTSFNNSKDGEMASRPIKGERLDIELWVNTSEIAANKIVCTQIVYGYKDLFNNTQKSFGKSGNCNININCKEGEPWQDIKRSVVMTLVDNNTRKCSGTLLNNTAQDSTPYVLTADHCGTAARIFIFNYESNACIPNTDGSLSNSIYGATLRARNYNSDFILFELDTIPPPSYNVFYAGWSALPSPAQYATCIHHPKGDVKKISISNGAVESEIYRNVGSVENHWRVNSWLKGTTEPGSSGSSLFNENQRVVGQLHGGTADCSNPNGSDSYGKFSKSWNANLDSSQSLYYWLDPLNTNQLTIDGLDPIAANHNLDLALVSTYDFKYFFCDSVFFNLLLKNKGQLAVDSFTVQVLNGNQTIDSVRVIKSLNRSETEIVTLSSSQLPFGSNDIKIILSEVNGTSDQNSTNDTLNRSLFNNSAPSNLYFELKTDDWGDETTWKVSTYNFTPPFTLYKGGPYESITGGKVYKDTLCFFDSCFTFKLFDSYKDGFNGPSGNGYLLLTDDNGDTLIFENNFTNGQESYTFCLSDTSTIIPDRKIKSNTFELFPNPIQRGENLKWSKEGFENSHYDIEIFNPNGELISSFTNISKLKLPTYIAQGLYILKAKKPNQSEWEHKKKLIVY